LTRTDTGPVRLFPSGMRPAATAVTLRIRATRGYDSAPFINLVTAPQPASGELRVAWSQFEMGCERCPPFEALTDYLARWRALLEPEGPQSCLLPSASR